MAGNICNTDAYEAVGTAIHTAVRAMFEEQIAGQSRTAQIFSLRRPLIGTAKPRLRST
jgi:hypothetical protein